MIVCRGQQIRRALVIFAITPLWVAPMGLFGPVGTASGQRWCFESMQPAGNAWGEETAAPLACCTQKVDGATPTEPAASRTPPDPEKSPGGDSCCVPVSFGVVVGVLDCTSHVLVDTVSHVVAVAVHSPVYPGWRDPLLRPPIC